MKEQNRYSAFRTPLDRHLALTASHISCMSPGYILYCICMPLKIKIKKKKANRCYLDKNISPPPPPPMSIVLLVNATWKFVEKEQKGFAPCSELRHQWNGQITCTMEGGVLFPRHSHLFQDTLNGFQVLRKVGQRLFVFPSTRHRQRCAQVPSYDEAKISIINWCIQGFVCLCQIPSGERLIH